MGVLTGKGTFDLTHYSSSVYYIYHIIEYACGVLVRARMRWIMAKRAVKETVRVTIGGVVVEKFSKYRDNLELIIVLRCEESFFPVVLIGDRAHRFSEVSKGQWVEIKGKIAEHSGATEKGWRSLFSVVADKVRLGEGREKMSSPFEYIQEMPKGEIFNKCLEMSKM